MGKNGRAFTIFGYDQEDLMRATTRVANIKMEKLVLDTDKFKNVQLPMQRSRREGGERRGGFGGGRRDYREGGRGGGDRSQRGGGRSWHGGGGNSNNRHEYKRGSR
jgi:hypothetical protein